MVQLKNGLVKVQPVLQSSSSSFLNPPKKYFMPEYLSNHDDIKPCPFCGNRNPFSYYNAFTAYLGCDTCKINFGSVKVVFKQAEIPSELKKFAKPANALQIREDDGSLISWPEHGLYGINCIIALDHAGLLSKWNKRA